MVQNTFEDELEPIATLPSSARYFVDDHQNSRYAPVPGTVYHYEVRPIVDDIITRPSGSAPRVRVFTPPQNFSLVHRWMANKTHCDLVAPGTELDPTNYSCDINTITLDPDDGSETQVNANYDIGHDMLVMQVEAGYPYHRKGCTGGVRDDGACIGNDSPDENNVEAVTGTVYYDRRSGKCYRKAEVPGSWVLTQLENIDQDKSLLANSTNSKKSAVISDSFILNGDRGIHDNRFNVYCHGVGANIDNSVLGAISLTSDGDFDGIDDDTYSAVKNKFFSDIINFETIRLPSRKEQVAFMHWDEGVNISTLEIGESLNSSPKCNTNYVSGFEDKFTNAEGGGVSYPFADSATLDAEDHQGDPRRSIITGSEITKSCQSKYGIQDHVGNMAELTITTDEDLKINHLTGANVFTDGVAADPNPIDIDNFDYLKFDDFLPTFDGTGADGNTHYVEPRVGGLNVSALQNDQFDATEAIENLNNVITGGGSYKDGNAAGVSRVEFPTLATIGLNQELGYRCVIPIYEKSYFETVRGEINPEYNND